MGSYSGGRNCSSTVQQLGRSLHKLSQAINAPPIDIIRECNRAKVLMLWLFVWKLILKGHPILYHDDCKTVACLVALILDGSLSLFRVLLMNDDCNSQIIVKLWRQSYESVWLEYVCAILIFYISVGFCHFDAKWVRKMKWTHALIVYSSKGGLCIHSAYPVQRISGPDWKSTSCFKSWGYLSFLKVV